MRKECASPLKRRKKVGAATPAGGGARTGHKKPREKKGAKSVWKKIGKAALSIFLIMVITGSIVVGAFAIYVLNFVDGTMDVDLDNLKLAETTIVYVKNSETGEYEEYKRFYEAENNRIWVNIEDIPQQLQDAFVAIEDKRFYEHEGVDWRRTVYAFANMVIHMSTQGQGGSTITQQLVKNLTNDADKSPARKIQEIMRAQYLEKNFTKKTILECYLNKIPLSATDSTAGVQSAAQYYFGKDVGDLSLVECATLAAIPKGTSKYNPYTNPDNNKKRRQQVLYEMKEQGYISQEEYEQAKDADITLVGEDAHKAEVKPNEVHNYFIDTLIDDVVHRLETEKGYSHDFAQDLFYTGGLRIYATMDPRIQKIMESGYESGDIFPKLSGDEQPQSAMMIMDYSGNIVGVVGGRGEKTGNRLQNRATMSRRQPGSSLKPLSVYAPALENNLINYSTLYSDTPSMKDEKNQDWPRNYSGRYSGNRTVEYALEVSLNTVPVRIVKDMTVDRAYDFAVSKFHLQLADEDRTIRRLPIGDLYKGVSVEEMTAAFATFGNLGMYYEPYTFTLIEDSKGDVVMEKPQTGTQTISPDTAMIMNELLQQVVTGPSGTGRVARFGNMPIFAKTGTAGTEAQASDRWFVGGTPYYIGACWFGYEKSSTPLPKAASSAPHVAWREIMSQVHQGLTVKDFPTTDTVVSRHYCVETGKLATTGCPHTAVGWYKTGSLPGLCTSHAGSAVDSNSSSSSGGGGGGSQTATSVPETTPEATKKPEPTTEPSVDITLPPVEPTTQPAQEPTTQAVQAEQ